MLISADHVIFFIVGVMFFIAAFALAARASVDLWGLITGPYNFLDTTGTQFLNEMLLVLMLVELAYTVIATLRGAELSAEPFLIVGLIAVIRRILILTITTPQLAGVKESGGGTIANAGWFAQHVELGILTAVVLVFVISIVLLRRIPPHQRIEDDFSYDD